MKVLITGGAGFIGSAIATELIANGIDVRLLDIRPSKNVPETEFAQGSILDKYIVSEAVEGCDAVIHLAAMLGVRKTDHLRLQCLNINIEGSINVFEACVKHGVKKVVFSSSSEVYGESDSDSITEESPLKPKSVYAVSKIAAEEYLRGYARKYGFDFSVVRFFNVYGVGQVAEFVVPRFIKMVMDGISPTVYGTGEQVRSFCNMRDAARGVHLALTNKASSSQVFNIGNDNEPISMKDLAKLVIDISGKKFEVEYRPMEKSDRDGGREIYMRRPDISKAKKLLKYEPRVSLEDGIRELFESADIAETWFEPIKIQY